MEPNHLDPNGMIRKLSPFVAAVLLALVVALLGDTGLAEGVLYALAGFFGGILCVGGTLVALGLRPSEFVDDIGGEEGVVPAGLAANLVGEVALTNIHVKLVIHPLDRLEQDEVAPDRPTVAPAGPALRTRACPI
jgi:hypothetical protein